MCAVKNQHASCNRHSEIYTLRISGVLAQLVERLNGIEEVTGSNPVGSKASARSRYPTERDSLLDALTGAQSRRLQSSLAARPERRLPRRTLSRRRTF